MISRGRSILKHKETYKDELEKVRGGKLKLESKLECKGRKILGNAIIRLFGYNLKNSIGIWKKNVKIAIQKEKVLRKVISRVKISYKQQTMTAWVNWMKYPIINSIESKLKKRVKEKVNFINCKNVKLKKFEGENKSKYDKKQAIFNEN